MREELGSSVADARMLKAQVLAMGDGTGAQEPTAGVKVGTSEVYGPAGKVKFHPWSEVVQPANRARRTFVIQRKRPRDLQSRGRLRAPLILGHGVEDGRVHRCARPYPNTLHLD